MLNLKDHVAIHLDETSEAVIGETLVVGLSGESGDRGVVQAEIENRVHHARHGGPGAGADGNEKRLVA